MEKLAPKQVLDILSEALMLFYKEEHWSKNCCATTQGQECPPWDLHADAWSSFGAIEAVLAKQEEKLIHLTQIVGELEKDLQKPLLSFDVSHTHEEVIEAFYRTMKRISTGLNLVMVYPELDDEPNSAWPVVFFEQAALDVVDRVEEELRERFEAALAEERDAWEYARGDE
jgi:hypothetical protein